MATKTKARSAKVADSYLDLVMELPLASIKSEEQYALAQGMIDRLLTQGKLDRGERMYLDALSDLLATYEDAHCRIGPPSDADMLRHLMDMRDLGPADIERETGLSKVTVADIITGKKMPSRAMIRTLSRFFKVDPSVFAPNV